MGLEEPPHCPFEVIAACRSGGWEARIEPVGRDIEGSSITCASDGGSGGGYCGSGLLRKRWWREWRQYELTLKSGRR